MCRSPDLNFPRSERIRSNLKRFSLPTNHQSLCIIRMFICFGITTSETPEKGQLTVKKKIKKNRCVSVAQEIKGKGKILRCNSRAIHKVRRCGSHAGRLCFGLRSVIVRRAFMATIELLPFPSVHRFRFSRIVTRRPVSSFWGNLTADLDILKFLVSFR